MIAISSFRPLADDEYSRNQVAAWKSWQSVFDAIFFFNHPEHGLASPITRFIPWEPFPKILEMVELAAAQKDWACIVNADIVVGGHFRMIEKKLRDSGAVCASSWRWEFLHTEGPSKSKVVDNGLDFFAAHHSVWNAVAHRVPEQLRHGCQRWDSWMLGAFNRIAGPRLVGITHHKVIFHPKHGERRYGHDIPDVGSIGTPYWQKELPR